MSKSFSRPVSYGVQVDFALLLLRLTFGLSMLVHGVSKWGMLFSGNEIEFMNFFGIGDTASLALAVFAEVVCAILLALGLFTRWALIPLIITMAVAFFYVHIGDEFGRQEKSILFGIAYISLWLTGPGKFSLDGLFRKS